MSRIEKALERVARLKKVEGLSESINYETDYRPNIKCLLDVVPLEVNNPMLISSGETSIAVNEEYNKLRSLIVNLSKGDTFGNTLLVTSTVSDEGKTLTALNLSIALAREYDHTVLLVDADLRRPSVHEYLGIEPKFGLIQCLKDNIPLCQALIKTGIGKLVVLPAGGIVPDPVEFLSSSRMREIVHELKTRYSDRFVVFDSPPALNFADAQVLANIVDGTIFVARERVVKEGQLRKTLDSFKDKNLLGVVFNDSSLPILESYYYY